MHSPDARTTGRFVGLLTLALALLLGGTLGSSIAAAQGDPHPRDIAITLEEAGKEAFVVVDEEGEDGRSRWVHRRWGRDRDNEDVSVGPIITDNTVWVARDVAAAQAIFKEQADKNRDFPEAEDRHEGPLDFKVPPMGDELVSWGSCIKDRCEGRLDLHRRVVMRKGNNVTVLYLFGRERTVTEEDTVWFLTQLHNRM